MTVERKKDKKFKFDLFENFPHSFVILFFILVIVAISTHFIPAGAFDKVEIAGKTVTKAGSFHFIDPAPTSFIGLFNAIPMGLQSAAALIFMILLIGGAIRVFDSTGAIKGALTHMIKVFGTDKSEWILAFVIIFFAAIGAFPSMFEGVVPFAPICVSIALALGYDVVVGVAIGLVSVVIGWTAGPTNPWTVGIGQSIGQLPMFSGIGYRLILLVCLTAISIAYILKYARKVKADKNASFMAGIDISECNTYNIDSTDESNEFTTKHKIVLLDLVATIGVILYGTFNWKWGLTQMSSAYIIGAIVAGLIAGYGGGKIADEILEGGKSIFTAAMAVGLARAIQVIMDTSHISDTIVYYLSLPLEHLPAALTAVGMFAVQTLLNFFVPSGSGLAMVTMPIMIPLSDLINVNRQIAILAFQFGDGLSNLIFPTTAVTISFLSVGKIPFNKWLKFAFPFVLITWAFAIVALVVATLIGWA